MSGLGFPKIRGTFFLWGGGGSQNKNYDIRVYIGVPDFKSLEESFLQGLGFRVWGLRFRV